MNNFVVINPSERGYYAKLTNWMNALLKLKHSDYLQENDISYSIERYDYSYYDEMLKQHNFKVIDFLSKTPQEIIECKESYEEIAGVISL